VTGPPGPLPGPPADALPDPLRAHAVALARLRWWHLEPVSRLEPLVFGPDSWSPELFWSEMAQGDARYYLVALAGDTVVGYGGLATQGPEAFIQTVAVAGPARRSGVGTRLMVALLRKARARGARSVGLEVRTDNDAAQALYRRLGFARVGMRRGYYQPSGADAFVMAVADVDAPRYADVLDRAAPPEPVGALRSAGEPG
jgi:ribosomal-protein-alanine N-acetyltransferase